MKILLEEELKNLWALEKSDISYEDFVRIVKIVEYIHNVKSI